MTEKRINELLSCDNCKFATCEQCEISYNDKKLIKKYIEEKDKQIEQYQNMLATNDMIHIRKCENKDKIIDSMVKVMINSSICDCFIKQKSECCSEKSEKICDEYIKQYFKNII